MRHIGGDVYDVADSKLLCLSAIDRGSANFVWLNGFRRNHRPPHNERGLSAFDDQDINLSFMKFGAAVTLPM